MKVSSSTSIGLVAVMLSFGLVHCGSDEGGASVDDAQATETSSSEDSSSIDTTVPADTESTDAIPEMAVDSSIDSAVEAATDAATACKTYDDTSDGTAKVLDVFGLPKSTSLRALDPYLTDAQLAAGVSNGALDVNPGPGSGLEYAGGCNFYLVSDRGPNGDHLATDGSVDGKTFPLLEYTPAVVKVSLDHSTGAMSIDARTPLVDDLSQPVGGLPNGPADASGFYDRAFLRASDTSSLVFDAVDGGFHVGSRYLAGGIDPEDVRRLPSGDFAIVEEYSPSLAIVDGTTGKVKVRYTPKGVKIPKAGYTVKDTLPAVFANRRSNKGFEGLAISKDGKTAYLVLQSPMGSDTDAKYALSLVNRILKLDISDPLDAKVVGQYLVIHNAATALGAKAKDQAKVYFNSATWIADDHLLLLERVSGRFKLYDVDLAHNGTKVPNVIVEGTPAGDTLSPEDVTAGSGYSAMGLVPASWTEVLDSNDLAAGSLFTTDPSSGKPSPDKIEGLAVINKSTVAIANDNDFGIGTNTNEQSRIWILRLKSPLVLAP
ncbi:MAG: esterase-like activity of phytase family protein [Polyangiales bacterium]